MNLAQLQLAFVEAIDDPEAMAGINPLISSTPPLSTAERISIYRDSLTMGMINALELNFPVCKKIVGDVFFLSLAEAYIAKYPSMSADLGVYGDALPTFIRQFSPAQSLPYLADVAALEWGWLTCFNGRDATTLDFAQLHSLTAAESECVIFKLQANALTLASDFPIDQIWQLAQTEKDDTLDISNDPVSLLIWRPEWEVYIERVSLLQWQILAACLAQLTIREICESITNAAEQLPMMAAKGWFGSFDIKEE